MTEPVNFNTTQYGNTSLVFWVVTWMQDANGNLVHEMTGHGLKANPAAQNFQQISQVPVETYSNNVGLYGSDSPFFIYPAGNGSTGPGMDKGLLQSVKVETNKNLLLDERAKVTVQLRARGAAVDSVTVTYYHGNPRRDGKLFGVEKIAHMDPDVIYQRRAFFQPHTCGVHQVFARAWVKGSADMLGEFTASVAIQPIDEVKALFASTDGTAMSAQLRHSWISGSPLHRRASRFIRHK